MQQNLVVLNVLYGFCCIGFDWIDSFQSDIAQYLGAPKVAGGVPVYDADVLDAQMRAANIANPGPRAYSYIFSTIFNVLV